MKTKSHHVIVYSGYEDRRAHEIRDFLSRSDVPFTSSPVDEPRGLAVFIDGEPVTEPTVEQVARVLGLYEDTPTRDFDVAIYGAGPAGLSAAVYAASEGLSTVLVERDAVGGQAGQTSLIENYLGFPKGISGADLAERAREQAIKFGVEILVLREGVSISGGGVCSIGKGGRIKAKANVFATGVKYRKLRVQGEAKLLGTRLFYGPGVSEQNAITKTTTIAIVGAGNSAAQAAVNFARRAKLVTLYIRQSSLKDTVSSYLVDKIAETRNIDIKALAEVTGFGPESSGIVNMYYRDGMREGKPEVYARTNLVFVCIGGEPNTDWSEGCHIAKDEAGYVLTGLDVNGFSHDERGETRLALPYETSEAGIFAIGDVRHGSIKRAAAAVGEGAGVVPSIFKYFETL